MSMFNDTIDIFVKQQPDGKVVLSDDGNTLANLELVGVSRTCPSEYMPSHTNLEVFPVFFCRYINVL